jgi:hypothetical protein
MPEESPDVLALTRAFAEVGGSVEDEMAFYGPNPVYDLSPMGIGIFEGHAAIRAFLEGWMASYADYEEELLDVRDLGKGICFAAIRESARPLGSDAHTRIQSRYGFAVVWVDGKIERLTAFPTVDEARAAAERLAQERG